MDPFTTPILFVLYNRLEVAKRTFEQIRKIRPQKLYVACDGYKKEKPGDQEKVESVRRWILGAIDWECQVKTRFAEENQGCKYGPANAISWVLECEAEAIILEDDILADESFFWYCRDMLERYKDDERVMLIGGYKALEDYPIEGDYFFSAFGQIWGWATWRRAWSYYDIDMKKWQFYREKKLLFHVFGNDMATILTENMDWVYQGKLDAWDYPWTFTQVSNSGLTILPKCNLIENIGYGVDATHTSEQAVDFCRKSLTFPLQMQENVVRNWEYDKAYAKKCMKVKKVRRFIRKFIPKSILKKWYQFRKVKAMI